jgi:hypothetical protein
LIRSLIILDRQLVPLQPILPGRDAKLTNAVFLKLCIRHQGNQRHGASLLQRLQAFSKIAGLGARAGCEN